jgi:uncharacterized protein (DUF433 family)
LQWLLTLYPPPTGQTLEEFLEDFEGVTREQSVAVLEVAADDLLKDLDRL